MKHIHFVGIKGVGMTPLALIAKEAGFVVTGSDIASGFITDTVLRQSGITPLVGFAVSHSESVDMVITSGANGGYDNEEVLAAKEKGIPVMTQGEAVAAFMDGKILGKKESIGIAVGGTHGKTTTTAMIAHLLFAAGLDPSWVVGTSQVPSIGFGGHFGKGKYFVAEADEYANEPQYDKTPKMLLFRPSIAVITNIEHDHPDVYPTLADVEKAFLLFAQCVSKDGFVITYGDDEKIQHLLKHYSGNVFTYGQNSGNTFQIVAKRQTADGWAWKVLYNDTQVSLALPLLGEHNIANATAAFIAGLQCGISVGTLQKALQTFKGTKRRMEYIGQMPTGAFLYDDYAHHPTEIRKTLEALKKAYPEKHIVCLFQPHTFSRTKLLFEEFITSLSLADMIVLTDIYSSQRESFDPTISSRMLVERLKGKTNAVLARSLSDVVKYVLSQHFSNDFIVLTMGAGDVYNIANQLLQ